MKLASKAIATVVLFIALLQQAQADDKHASLALAAYDTMFTAFVTVTDSRSFQVDVKHLTLQLVSLTQNVSWELAPSYTNAMCGEDSIMRCFAIGLTMPRLPAGVYRMTLGASGPLVTTDAGLPVPIGTPDPKQSDSVQLYFPKVDSAPDNLSPLSIVWKGVRSTYAVQRDASSRRLEHELGARPVWTFGDYHFECQDDSGGVAVVRLRDHSHVTIKSVRRVHHLFARLSLGTMDPMSYCLGLCHADYHFYTREPLLVSFTLDRGSFEVVPRLMTVSRPARPFNGNCATSYALFADDWDVRRAFTTVDPRAAHPEWNPDLRRAMLGFQLQPGMTHEMAAFARGFPSRFGSPDELLLLERWSWYPKSYYAATAIFSGDRLTKLESNSSP